MPKNIVQEIKKDIETTDKRKIESVESILKKKPKDEPFVLAGMIPEGAITALTADVGKGKSLFMLKAVQAIADGEKLFGAYETKKKKILILDLEMSENDIISRVHSVLQTPSDIFFHGQSFQIDMDNDYKWLIETIKEEKFDMLVVDTLNSAHGKEENSSSEMRVVNRRLLDLINDTGITILYLHHHRKLQQGEKMGQASSRGSTEILAKVASHLLLDSRDLIVVGADGMEKRGMHLTITQHKSRLAEGLKPFGVDIWYDPFDKKTSWDYTGEISEINIKEEAKGFVLVTIKEGDEWNFQELMEEKDRKKLKFGVKNLKAALKELIDIGRIMSRTEGRKKVYFLINSVKQNG